MKVEVERIQKESTIIQVPIQFKNYTSNFSVEATALLIDIISQAVTSLTHIVQTLKPSQYELVLSSNQLNPLPSTKRIEDVHLADDEFFICNTHIVLWIIYSE